MATNKVELENNLITLNKEVKRLDFLDYAKALCIFFVVFIHVGFSFLNNVALFAMPVFFMVTGCTFSLGKRSVSKSIFQRFKTVLIPFFIYMVFYTAIEVARAYVFDYGTWKIMFPSLANLVYGSGIIPFDFKVTAFLKEIMSYKAQVSVGVDLILPTNCHLWFLPAMFVAYSLFVLIVDKTKESNLIKVVSVIVLTFIASIEVIFPRTCQLPFGFGRGALGAVFMLVGFWIKEYKIFEKNSVLFHLITCLVSGALFVGALILESNGGVLVRSYYGPYGVFSLILTLVGGAAGAYLIFELSRVIERLPFGSIKKFLSFSGKNVMTVYALHMAVKTVLDIFYVKVINSNAVLDEFMMGLMPESAWLYMVFEAIICIAICLIIAKLIKKIQKR